MSGKLAHCEPLFDHILQNRAPILVGQRLDAFPSNLRALFPGGEDSPDLFVEYTPDHEALRARLIPDQVTR